MRNKIITFIIITLLTIVLPINIFADYKGMDTDINIGSTGAITSSQTITNRIFCVIQVIGTVIAVIALIIIGMRYMLSSVEEKASMKGLMAYYIIGAILVAATANVLKLAYDIINGLRY